MKTLQSNFTTPEQSKRLLELGVPAWTADCYYYDMFDKHIKVSYIDADRNYKWDLENEYAPKPCWSVGRLIELYVKAKGLDFMYFRIMSDADMIDSIVRMFVENQNEMDFSKLE